MLCSYNLGPLKGIHPLMSELQVIALHVEELVTNQSRHLSIPFLNAYSKFFTESPLFYGYLFYFTLLINHPFQSEPPFVVEDYHRIRLRR